VQAGCGTLRGVVVEKWSKIAHRRPQEVPKDAAKEQNPFELHSTESPPHSAARRPSTTTKQQALLVKLWMLWHLRNSSLTDESACTDALLCGAVAQRHMSLFAEVARVAIAATCSW